MDLVLRQADAVRATLWRWTAKTGFGRRCLSDRGLRLAALACGHMCVALALTVLAPLWLLLIGPLVLGVPHVVADVRYLLIGRTAGVTRAAAWALLVPLGGMMVGRVVVVLGGPHLPALEVALGAAAMAAAVGFAPVPRALKLTGLGLVCGVAAVTLISPYDSALVVAHLHNLVALGLWLAWMRGSGPASRQWAVVGFFGLCVALLMAGVLEPAALSVDAWDAPGSGLTMEEMVWTLAPGMSPEWGLRLVLVYAFAQALHYTVWLRMVPQSQTHQPRRAPSTLARAWRELRLDIGKVGLLIAVILAVLVPVAGLFDGPGTRATYLTVVLFHGWLELAVIAHLLVRRAARAKAV